MPATSADPVQRTSAHPHTDLSGMPIGNQTSIATACPTVGVRRVFAILFFTALLGGMSCAELAAEEIRLKNGDQLTGHIWRIGPRSMLLETPYATLWIEQVFVDRISIVGVEPRVRVKPKTGEAFEGTLSGATGSELVFRVKDDQVRRLPWAEVESVSFYESDKSEKK